MKTKMQFIVMTILVILSGYSFGQGGAPGNFRPLVGALPLGWTAGTPGNLQIRNDFAGQPINFYTGGAGPLFQRMTILGSGGPTAGFVGIGNGLTPTFRLDVQNDINVRTTGINEAYRINGITALQVPLTRNVFVGHFAGINNVNISAEDNVFVGFNAGNANLSGDRNTFVGSRAGQVITNGRFNTFIGADAGLSFTNGSSNTFVGEHSGFRQVSGNNNSYFGSHSGQAANNGVGNNNTFLGMNSGPAVVNADDNTFTGAFSGNACSNGDKNCMYGVQAGGFTNNGSSNVFMGYRAGFFNRGGDSCTYLGREAGVPNGAVFNNIRNSSAIGVNATVRANNKIILGNNRVNVGIGLSNDNIQNGPQNKLEIDAGLNGFNPSANGTVGVSGLRFRDLHFGNLTVPNPGTGVLSVDANGDVIYVPGGGTALGGICGTNPPALTNDWEIPLGIFNYVFSGQGTVGTNVGVGTNCAPGAKLHSRQSNNSFPINRAIWGENNNNTVNAFNVGVEGDAFIGNLGNSIGVLGLGASNGGNAYGGYFVASGSGITYGIYASAPFGPGQTPGGPPVGNSFAGYFDGDVVRTGTDNFTSDGTLKQNIDTISNISNVLSQLKPRTFFYDTLAHTNINLSAKRQYGFIAQDVETILPELVGSAVHPAKFDSLGNIITPALTYKTLNYQAFIALMMKGMQEQQSKIDSLNDAVAQLSSAVNSCCLNGIKATNNINNNSNNNQLNSINVSDVKLTDAQSIVLEQNVPNPFAEQTTISYSLPDNTGKAQLLFYNASGKLIQSVDLSQKGQGQLNVFANDLSNGVYTYTLVVDGNIIESKKMLKQ
ncbi:MAG: tail fiber domain-containing protein [Bacteroidota bacterium]